MMKWSEINEKIEGIKSNYDYVVAITPLGKIIIEWKGWKQSPSYDIVLNGTIWIGTEYSLEKAKQKAKNYLINTYKQLKTYLNMNNKDINFTEYNINTVEEFIKALKENNILLESYLTDGKIKSGYDQLKCTRIRSLVNLSKKHEVEAENPTKIPKLLKDKAYKDFTKCILFGESNIDEKGKCLDVDEFGRSLPQQDGFFVLADAIELATSDSFQRVDSILLNLEGLLKELNIKSEFTYLSIPKSCRIELVQHAWGNLEDKTEHAEYCDYSALFYCSKIQCKDKIFKYNENSK